MPIIEQVNPAVPLAQGDLLKDVPLYISQIDPSTGAFSPQPRPKQTLRFFSQEPALSRAKPVYRSRSVLSSRWSSQNRHWEL